jgi:hypothetical protein
MSEQEIDAAIARELAEAADRMCAACRAEHAGCRGECPRRQAVLAWR